MTRPEDHPSYPELVVRGDGATLDEARAKARGVYGTRTVVREEIVAAGGQFMVKVAAESEGKLREREGQSLPAGAVVRDRRLVLPKYEVLQETASSQEELLANLRVTRPQHRVVSVVCQRPPAIGVFGVGKHLGEYEVTIIDSQVRSEVSYEVRSCVDVVVLATPDDCLRILREPVSPDGPGRALAAARCLAEQADASHGDGILDAVDTFRRDESAERNGVYPALMSALERIASPELVNQLLARWAPALAEWRSWQEASHLRAVAALLARFGRSAAGFEALARCLRSPDLRVRTSARDVIQRDLANVPVPPAARPHLQEYEKQRAGEVKAWLGANHPDVDRDRFCLDLLGKLAEREMRIAGDRDELADWCRAQGLDRTEGETLTNVLISVGLAVGSRQDHAGRPAGVSYGITDDGRSLVGASLFA